jgi:hypothetical protein
MHPGQLDTGRAELGLALFVGNPGVDVVHGAEDGAATAPWSTGWSSKGWCRPNCWFSRSIATLRMAGFGRCRGKMRIRRGRWAVFPAVTVETPVVDRRLRLKRGDQVLITAISGPTPKIVIIRLRL